MESIEFKPIDYTTVTEVSGEKITAEQLRRMHTRYKFASSYCIGKDVLEVACGSGQGLGYLSRYSRKVVAGDYDEKLVALSQRHYGDRIQIVRLDAHHMPFEDSSFDTVILFEAIYYLRYPERFIQEARRILRPDGVLIIGSVNKVWDGFNPSPFSFKYFSLEELEQLLRREEFEVSLFADCFAQSSDFRSKLMSYLKKGAVKFNLIPKTMRGKKILKRIFVGKLVELPSELIEEPNCFNIPIKVALNGANSDYKVIFAVARKIR